MPAESPHLDPLSLNLSYVLNEPSDSRAVRRAARVSRRFARRHKKILQSFRKMGDEEFRSCLHVSPRLRNELTADSEVELATTAQVGIPELLAKAISLSRGTHIAPDVTNIDIDPMDVDEGPVLFGHPAAIPGITGTPGFAGGLVVMPEERSLLLCGAVTNDPLRVIEDVIRDYHDQWTPGRALWRAPLEMVDRSILIPAETAGNR
jgi:hypothetical protein